MHFSDFELDERLLKALPKMGLIEPTLIQEKTLQFGLEGKDINGKAKTGSGKTAAYCLPMLDKILKSKVTRSNTRFITAY
jgi:ATP-dependent RNA helicase DDX56/DBP9